MTDLKDSGARTQFASGAQREIVEEKGRCDLLPMISLYHIYQDDMFRMFNDYIYTGNLETLIYMLRLFKDQRYDGDMSKLMLDVSKHYADGARKYSERNWELGIPLHCFIDSAVRHYIKYKDNWDDEPHDRAFVWNILGCLWTQFRFDGVTYPELFDLPWCYREDVRANV